MLVRSPSKWGLSEPFATSIHVTLPVRLPEIPTKEKVDVARAGVVIWKTVRPVFVAVNGLAVLVVKV